jgi:hypothetical protein
MSEALTPVEATNLNPPLEDMPAGWEQDFLARLGVSNPTKADIQYVDQWFLEEHGSPDATGGASGGEFNAFDTTLRTAADETKYNPQGVQNYSSEVEGNQANAETLADSDPSYGYSKIVTGLKQGASVGQLEAAENASSWGTTFSGVGSSPAPSSGSGTADVTAALSSSSSTSAGGLADDLASGVLGALRDLGELAGGLALILLGLYLIGRDLSAAGVPLGPVAKLVAPGGLKLNTAKRRQAREGDAALDDARRRAKATYDRRQAMDNAEGSESQF